MPIDPRELRKGSGLYELITEDRLCDRCRYSLKGLPSNGKCPECGHPIRRRGRANRFTDNLVDAPAFYLRTLAFGLSLMAGTIFLLIALSLLKAFGPAKWFLPLAFGQSVLTVTWWMGVYIATAQRPLSAHTVRDPLLESVWLRNATRVLQALWAAGVLLYFVAWKTNAVGLNYAAAGAILVATFGLVPLAIRLAALADWAGDTGVSERFKVAAWSMAFFGVLDQVGSAVAPINTLLTRLITFVGVWSILGVVIAQGLFMFSVYQLATVAVWAVRNASAASAAARRTGEMRERHEREMINRTATAAALMKHGAAPKRKVRPTFGENIVQRPDAGAAPYKVDPEPAPPAPKPRR